MLNDYGIGPEIRKSTGTPFKHYKIYRNEYKEYLGDYGVCQTYFQMSSYKKINFKAICGIRDGLTGMVIDEQIFVLPWHAPDKDENATIKLFTTLASALYESITKLSKEIPSWIDERFIFPEEKKLAASLHRLNKEVTQIEANLDLYRIFKGCLCFSGDSLVESVSTIFESFFKLRVVKDDQFVEDTRLFIPQEGEDKMIALVEIKGVNSGIKREHINQVDSHRERLGLPSSFPTLLIVNAKMDATKFEEKELEVAHEQVKKAVTDNVLIMRTIDLVNLIYLIEEGIAKHDELLSLFQTENGWLNATKEVYKIHKE